MLTEHPNSSSSPTIELTENDVICGRGRGKNHPGNIAYRHLIELNKTLYTTCLAGEKIKISQSIVVVINEQGGRFLEKKTTKTGEPASWSDIGFKKAVEKTSQALREGQPKRREIVEMTTTTTNGANNETLRSRGTEAECSLATATGTQEIMWTPPLAGKQQQQKEIQFEPMQMQRKPFVPKAPPMYPCKEEKSTHVQGQQPNQMCTRMNSSPEGSDMSLMVMTPLSQLSFRSGFSGHTTGKMSKTATSLGTISGPMLGEAMSIMDSSAIWNNLSSLSSTEVNSQSIATGTLTPLPFLNRLQALDKKIMNQHCQEERPFTVYAAVGKDGISCTSSISSAVTPPSSKRRGHAPVDHTSSTSTTSSCSATASNEKPQRLQSSTGSGLSSQTDIFLPYPLLANSEGGGGMAAFMSTSGMSSLNPSDSLSMDHSIFSY